MIEVRQSQEQRDNQAARIGAIFKLPDAAAKISGDGWRLDYAGGDKVLLRVELVEMVSQEEAEAIINGLPLE